MTIGASHYEMYPIMGYAINDFYGGRLPASESSTYAQLRQASGVPAPESAEGVNIDASRVIDILLGQLEQISYQLSVSRTEPQATPVVAEVNVGAEINMDAEVYASNEERVNALLEQYTQLRAFVEETDASYYALATSPFAGMLFGVDA